MQESINISLNICTQNEDVPFKNVRINNPQHYQTLLQNLFNDHHVPQDEQNTTCILQIITQLYTIPNPAHPGFLEEQSRTTENFVRIHTSNSIQWYHCHSAYEVPFIGCHNHERFIANGTLVPLPK